MTKALLIPNKLKIVILPLLEEDGEGECDEGHCVEFVGLVDVEVGVGEGREAEFAHAED